MKKNDPYTEDPVVREVREVRKRLWKEAGGTIEGLRRLLDREVPKRRNKSRTRRTTK